MGSGLKPSTPTSVPQVNEDLTPHMLKNEFDGSTEMVGQLSNDEGGNLPSPCTSSTTPVPNGNPQGAAYSDNTAFPSASTTLTLGDFRFSNMTSSVTRFSHTSGYSNSPILQGQSPCTPGISWNSFGVPESSSYGNSVTLDNLMNSRSYVRGALTSRDYADFRGNASAGLGTIGPTWATNVAADHDSVVVSSVADFPILQGQGPCTPGISWNSFGVPESSSYGNSDTLDNLMNSRPYIRGPLTSRDYADFRGNASTGLGTIGPTWATNVAADHDSVVVSCVADFPILQGQGPCTPGISRNSFGVPESSSYGNSDTLDNLMNSRPYIRGPLTSRDYADFRGNASAGLGTIGPTWATNVAADHDSVVVSSVANGATNLQNSHTNLGIMQANSSRGSQYLLRGQSSNNNIPSHQLMRNLEDQMLLAPLLNQRSDSGQVGEDSGDMSNMLQFKSPEKIDGRILTLSTGTHTEMRSKPIVSSSCSTQETVGINYHGQKGDLLHQENSTSGGSTLLHNSNGNSISSNNATLSSRHQEIRSSQCGNLHLQHCNNRCVYPGSGNGNLSLQGSMDMRSANIGQSHLVSSSKSPVSDHSVLAVWHSMGQLGFHLHLLCFVRIMLKQLLMHWGILVRKLIGMFRECPLKQSLRVTASSLLVMVHYQALLSNLSFNKFPMCPSDHLVSSQHHKLRQAFPYLAQPMQYALVQHQGALAQPYIPVPNQVTPVLPHRSQSVRPPSNRRRNSLPRASPPRLPVHPYYPPLPQYSPAAHAGLTIRQIARPTAPVSPAVPPRIVPQATRPPPRNANPSAFSAHIRLEVEDEASQLIGHNCLLCNRDLRYVPGSGPISIPSRPPTISVLPCGHTFHESCLDWITPQDQAKDPPCVTCIFG
ncbi:hypothetical protein NL676_026629 [Syzygium grande]|nr:hypothetical protein NL676_026629 [Syzygium grande]